MTRPNNNRRSRRRNHHAMPALKSQNIGRIQSLIARIEKLSKTPEIPLVAAEVLNLLRAECERHRNSPKAIELHKGIRECEKRISSMEAEVAMALEVKHDRDEKQRLISADTARKVSEAADRSKYHEMRLGYLNG